MAHAVGAPGGDGAEATASVAVAAATSATAVGARVAGSAWSGDRRAESSHTEPNARFRPTERANNPGPDLMACLQGFVRRWLRVGCGWLWLSRSAPVHPRSGWLPATGRHISPAHPRFHGFRRFDSF